MCLTKKVYIMDTGKCPVEKDKGECFGRIKVNLKVPGRKINVNME